ncbi:MAG: hypothetical protein HXX09_00250 [Bacteroidetes bacterium]|nr:hypothetical protein [Bacteroidota bacterium]
MKKVVLNFVLFFSIFALFGQKVPRFQKIPISTSGCYAYFPGTPTNFEFNYSPDSAKIYTGSFDFDGYTYGIVTVKFAQKTGNDKADLELLLIQYMDYLKTSWEITDAVGYGKGHSLESNPDATGVIDYWKTKDGSQLSVKGWIDNYYIGLLYILGKTEYPNINVVQLFQNGFRFPEK